jgi:hypothetical protein
MSADDEVAHARPREKQLPFAISATPLPSNATPRAAVSLPLAFTVTVSNQVWFPDSFNVAGYFIEVQAQSIHTNASAHVDIYDESGSQFVSLDTVTDGQGFVTYGGVRDFRVANYDSNGEQYPDAVYTVVVSTVQSGAGVSTATATNFIWNEPAWPTSSPGNLDTAYEIAYMPVFGDPSYGGISAVTLQGLIQEIYLDAEYHGAVQHGDDQNPFELNSETDWLVLLQDLHVEDVRNFYYFGHGGPGLIGRCDLSTNPPVLTFLSSANINTGLHNNPKSQSLTPHPYRFVFLDGCDTANGPLCETFGIPKKKNMTASTFTNKGLRYRAFMGWDNHQIISLAQSITIPHVNFVSTFFTKWATPDDENRLLTLRQAIDQSKGAWTEVDKHLVVYGFEGLLFYDTIP